ncbi:hypothetical protein [Halobacterium litoreum]|uniref:Uncharacterized protein n=1 Tax=Halobacterium litoreum TaxID=2039234 RepID=A0ABD5NEB8_9EURY|nr:hypothetical protein [Halobacterium litoreum]UHH13748.1 hypothetical protein LT972_01830 [Halobacterium litoreum]
MRSAYRGLRAATGVFVLATVAATLAFGVDWTLDHRFAILGASVGWGASVAVRDRRNTP